MKEWVAVANCSKAEIYEKDGKSLSIVHYFDFPEGREKSGEFLSDRPGRSHESIGHTRHAMGTQVDVHLHELKVFAKRIAEVLNKAKNERAYERLYIIAPPQFLGELRSLLSEQVKRCVIKEIIKDVTPDLPETQRLEWIKRYVSQE